MARLMFFRWMMSLAIAKGVAANPSAPIKTVEEFSDMLAKQKRIESPAAKT
jgi:hypothetical protein